MHHVFRRPDVTRGKFDRLSDIGYTYVQELAQIKGAAIVSPWPAPVASRMSESKASVGMGIKELAHDGKVTNSAELTRNLGIAVGSHVVRKATGKMFEVVKVYDEGVDLIDPDGVSINALHHSFLQGEYKIARPGKRCNCFDDHMNIQANTDWQFELIASRLKLALDAKHIEYKTSLQGLRIITEPVKNKGVVTTKDYDRGELMLYPVTPFVGKILHGKPLDPKHVPTQNEIVIGGQKHFIYLMKKDVMPTLGESSGLGYAPRAATLPFVAPFWHVITEQEENTRPTLRSNTEFHVYLWRSSGHCLRAILSEFQECR